MTVKSPFSLLIACAAFVGTFLGAFSGSTTFSSGEAWAQKKKVVVVQFKGPAADKYRIAVMKSVFHSGIDVVPDKTLVKVEADLGLQKVSDSYTGVSRELKLAGFVSGIITGGRRPKARVIVHDPSGKPIGGQIFQATSAPKLMAMVAAGSGPKVAAVLGGGGGGGEPVAEAPAEKAAVAAAEPAAKEDKAAAEEEEKPRKRKRGEDKAKEEDEDKAGADADVAASADEDEVVSKKKKSTGKGIRAAFVMRMFSRNFAYNQSFAGNQQGYQAPESKFSNLPLVPAPGIALEFFPMSSLGFFGSYNKAIAGSKDSGGSVYATTAFQWLIGAKGRIAVSSVEIEPSVGYGAQAFTIENLATAPGRINVAPVDYRFARLGSGLRIPLSSGGAFTVGGHYLYILGAGDILNEAKYFKGSAVGGELSADYLFPLSFAKGFDVNVGLDFRRMAFAFTPNKTPPNGRIAGGAIDQYVGLNLSLGYNIGL
jgi:hypothetical protein